MQTTQAEAEAESMPHPVTIVGQHIVLSLAVAEELVRPPAVASAQISQVVERVIASSRLHPLAAGLPAW